jgi:hypothetical protein
MSGYLLDANPGDGTVGAVDWTAGIIPGTTGNADPWAAGVAGSSGVAQGLGTGQHGVTLTDGGGGVVNAFSHAWDWINTPFRTPLDPWDIGLIVGIILIAIVVWQLILYHIRIAAETI